MTNWPNRHYQNRFDTCKTNCLDRHDCFCKLSDALQICLINWFFYPIASISYMDINSLKTFLEVAKRRHFGEASEALFVSQSTVSSRIKSLEDILGVELFVRERGNIHLTPSGEALITHAKSMLTLWSRAKQEIAMPKGIRDTLSIGGYLCGGDAIQSDYGWHARCRIFVWRTSGH